MERMMPHGQQRRRIFITTPQVHNTLFPILALTAAVLLWGGSFVAMRVAVTTIAPMTVMWCRMMIALVLIIPLAKSLFPINYRKGDWKLLLPMVMFQPCLYFLLESNVLQYTTSSQAGIISASVPVLVTIGAAVFLNESITLSSMAGIALSISGVISLTLLATPGGSGQNPLLGNIMEFMAMICAAGNMLIIKRLCNRYNPWLLTSMQIGAGFLFFVPGAFFLTQTPSETFTMPLTLSLIFLGGFVTFGAFGLYNWGISHIRAAKASSFINLIPVIAAILGWAILGEVLSLFQWLSACTVIVGVMISQAAGGEKLKETSGV